MVLTNPKTLINLMFYFSSPARASTHNFDMVAVWSVLAGILETGSKIIKASKTYRMIKLRNYYNTQIITIVHISCPEYTHSIIFFPRSEFSFLIKWFLPHRFECALFFLCFLCFCRRPVAAFCFVTDLL